MTEKLAYNFSEDMNEITSHVILYWMTVIIIIIAAATTITIETIIISLQIPKMLPICKIEKRLK